MATYDITADSCETCPLCGFEFAEDPLILVESGSVVRMRKDPTFLHFLADWRLPDREQPPGTVLSVFHFHCFQQLAGGEEWKVDPEPWQCHTCDHDFRKERYAFQVTTGNLDRDSKFVPDPEVNQQGILCSTCTMDVFGEGNRDEGELLLMGEAA